MNIFKSILTGILIGAALFFMPFFFLRFILFFLVIATVIRFAIGRRFRGGYRRGLDPAFTDSIRNMSDEEYNSFKQRFDSRCGDFNHYNRPAANSNQ